jgi:hypothetical protein
MRKVSMATRAELVGAISGRYVLGGRAEKGRMLDEFVALTGFHRKQAMRLLRGDCEPAKGGPRPRRPPNPLRLTAETSDGKWQVWFAHASCFKDKLIDPPDAPPGFLTPHIFKRPLLARGRPSAIDDGQEPTAQFAQQS